MRKRDIDNPPTISLVSLGCAKNTVDSERLLGIFVEDGWMIAAAPEDADICLLNTCGFIDAARSETAEVLQELCALKEESDLQAVVALGCMVERAAEVAEQTQVLAGADLLAGFRDYARLPKLCRELLGGGTDAAETAAALDFSARPRVQTGYAHHAYLKISEGCSNRCSFCTIPAIRGPQQSVPLELLLDEARSLIKLGARELEIIAQDSTSYGRDLYGERSLPRLLRALAEIETDCWFRLMYAYPPFLSDEILDVLASDPRFCPYIDMPLQHISDPILKAMGRGMGKADTIALLDRIAAKLPGAALRSTFIVGYPGESEAQFAELLDFVREGRFMHAGVFTYSQEVNTRAGREEDTVGSDEKARRAEALMEAQLDVSCRLLSEMIGRDTEVMIDSFEEDEQQGLVAVGHTQGQEIDVDGAFFIEGDAERLRRHQPGTVVPVRITAAGDYDLIGELRGK